MTQVIQPGKEEVRQYMAKRREELTPPASLEEIRRQLGWNLVEAERAETNRSKR